MGATPGQKTQLGNGAVLHAGGQSNPHSLVFKECRDIALGPACVVGACKAGPDSRIVRVIIHVTPFM